MRRYWQRSAIITGLVWMLAASWAWAAPAAPRHDASGARWSAGADMVFRHLPAEELQYATVLVQDRSGFVWAGTEVGLTRWDGYRTKVYTAEPGHPSSVPAGSVQAILPDASGDLWVGASFGGLARYDPRTDAFTPFAGGPAGLQDTNVADITSDGHGGLWIGTGTGLDHFEPSTGVVRHATVETDGTGSVNSVVQDSDGGVWIGTEKGLLYRGATETRFVAVPLGNQPGPAWTVRKLYRDHAGRLWIGTHSSGLFVLEPGAAVRQVRLSANATEPEGSRINAIVDTGRTGIWVSTLGDGIAVVEPDAGWNVRHIRHQIGISSSLLDDDVKSLMVSRDGMMWASTTLGLSRHNLRPDGVWTFVGEKSRDRPIPAVQVPMVLAHPDGRIWLGLGNGNGVVMLDAHGRRVGELRPDAATPKSALPLGMVTSMAALPDGDVVLGTTQGVYLADADGRAVSRIDVPHRIADAAVNALTLVHDTLWLGGTDGVWAVDLEHRGAPQLVAYVPPSRLGNRRVSALLRGDGDALWIGTESGLNRLHIASGIVDQVYADAGDPAAFAAGYVSSLLLDAQRRLWVSSMGVGVEVLVHDADAVSPMRFKRITERDGLPNVNVDVLVSDGAGSIWASTDSGLAVIDAETFAIRTLGEADGVALRQYWAGAGARMATGELLFGGIGGLTVVQPGRQDVAYGPPPLVVTEAKVGSRMLAASQFNGPNPTRDIMIRPGDRDLSVEFAALDYAAADQNRYSYRLQGYDQDWITTVASRRLASYTNLPPGNYTLQLRGSGPKAPWTPTTLDLNVQVVPAWYQAAWFYLAATLAGGFALVGLVQGRTSLLRRRERELHALVELRTQELRQSQRRLEEIAYCDPLTGLANRRRFNEDFRALVELALLGKASLTLLLIDLDRFKPVNDTLGHDVGDALLVEVAKRLGVAVRQGDRVARLGGDEFAVVMLGTEDDSTVDGACSRIIDSLGQPFVHEGRTLRVGASIGVAGCPRHAVNTDALYKSADLALYEAKRAGRNTWRIGARADVPKAVAMI